VPAALLVRTEDSGVDDHERPDSARIPEPMLTSAEVAAWLRVDVKTLRTYVRRRGLPCSRLGRDLRFQVAEVAQWLKRRKGTR